MTEPKYANGKNPNSLKNLIPCKKGEKRNPKGCPRREASLTRIARDMLPKVCPYDAKGRTWGEYLAERWMAESITNASYFKELMDRLEGKVTQPIEAQVKGDVTFVIGKGYIENKPDISTDKPNTG